MAMADFWKLSLTIESTIVDRQSEPLDIFWLRDESLESSDNLRDPDLLA